MKDGFFDSINFKFQGKNVLTKSENKLLMQKVFVMTSNFLLKMQVSPFSFLFFQKRWPFKSKKQEDQMLIF